LYVGSEGSTSFTLAGAFNTSEQRVKLSYLGVSGGSPTSVQVLVDASDFFGSSKIPNGVFNMTQRILVRVLTSPPEGVRPELVFLVEDVQEQFPPVRCSVALSVSAAFRRGSVVETKGDSGAAESLAIFAVVSFLGLAWLGKTYVPSVMSFLRQPRARRQYGVVSDEVEE
jgi:hypothetical protein